ncbi:hypothetical protein GGR51DRAFT_18886 [Nemania sp. FL0031]|nr:hypothetical protein GGR51DRAFT_18886 [Nemania sp. FL0031]
MDPGDENRGPALQSFSIFVAVFTVVLVTLRFWSRSLALRGPRNQVRAFWWDDWAALASTILLLVQIAIELVMIHKAGFGRHIGTLSDDEILLYSTLQFVDDFIFDTALTVTKFSGLLFLSRVFPRRANSMWFNAALWTCYFLNTGWLIGAYFGTIFFCDPVQKGWNPFLKGTCGETLDLFLGSAIPSVIIDFFILLTPLPKVLRLHTNLKRKIGLLIVFILGYAVIIVSIGRLVNVVKIGTNLNTDPTWESPVLFFWVNAEPAISIICLCLPAMLPLGRHLAHNYMEPAWSLISRFGSRSSLKSKSGNFSTNNNTYGDSAQNTIDGSKRRGSLTEFESRISEGSRQEILNLTPMPDNYRAHAKRGSPEDGTDSDIPLHSIRVEKDIRINSKDNPKL